MGDIKKHVFIQQFYRRTYARLPLFGRKVQLQECIIYLRTTADRQGNIRNKYRRQTELVSRFRITSLRWVVCDGSEVLLKRKIYYICLQLTRSLAFKGAVQTLLKTNS